MKHKVRTYILLVFVYLIVAAPFKVMEVIPGFADIRPVTLLGPIYALFYGIPGCVIFAVMNLVMDIVSGDLAWSCIAGLLANFAGPFFILYYWKRLSREDLHLRTMSNIMKHSVLIIFSAVLEAVIITPSVAFLYDVDWKLFFISVLLNTSAFPILFGIPLTVFIQEELGFKQISRKDM